MKTHIATGDTFRNRHVFETWQWVWNADERGWVLVDEDYRWSVEAVRLIPGIKVKEHYYEPVNMGEVISNRP